MPSDLCRCTHTLLEHDGLSYCREDRCDCLAFEPGPLGAIAADPFKE